MKKKMNTQPFTLIELLLVLTIIIILASMLLPALRTCREKTKEIQCRNNLKQIGTGYIMYLNDYNGFFYSVWEGTAKSNWYDYQWQYVITPYLGDKRYPWGTPVMSKAFDCPSADGFNCGFYKSDYSQNYYFGYNTPILRMSMIKAPASLTMLCDSDGDASFDGWATRTVNLPGLLHAKGANFIFCDGHAENLRQTAAVSDSMYWKQNGMPTP